MFINNIDAILKKHPEIINYELPPIGSIYEFFQHIEMDESIFVIAACLYDGIDPNYTIRMNQERRTNGDRFPLQIAIQNYYFDLAYDLILLGANTNDRVIQLDGKDYNNINAANIKKAIEFCSNFHIKYEVVNNEES